RRPPPPLLPAHGRGPAHARRPAAQLENVLRGAQPRRAHQARVGGLRRAAETICPTGYRWCAPVSDRCRSIRPASATSSTSSLGTGANAAIFSVVRAVLLRPPPYREPERLVTFLNARSDARGSITSSSLPDYDDWRARLTSFESFGVLAGWTFNVSGIGLPERVF